MKKDKAVEIVELKKVASFQCAYDENATNICVALAKAGRFVNILRVGGVGFVVEVYERT